ncbi:MAG: hypothetical protein ACK5Y2_13285 [Bdellovibrionales bacterium]
MDKQELRFIAGSVGTAILAMFLIFSSSWTRSARGKLLDDGFTISMPRPLKEMLLGFSLAHRTVKREVEGLPKKALEKKAQTPAGKGTTKAVADRGTGLKQAREKAIQAARRHHEQVFRARIVQESERFRRQLEERQRYEEEALGNPIMNRADNGRQNPNADQTPAEEDKRDAAAWKSLVLAQPTPENVREMVQAFQKGELDAESFYDIVEILMKDNSESKRNIGFWALSSTSHQRGFELAAQLSTEGDASLQPRLNEYMYNYNNPRSLGILDQVLRSGNAVASAAAAQVITRAVDRLRSGQTPGNPDQRGNRAQSPTQALTLSSYQRLIPTLQWLSTRSGTPLSQWAQNLLSQLRSNTSPA